MHHLRPPSSPPRRRAALGLAVAATIAAGSLTGCSSTSGAQQLAQQYVDLVATAGPGDLESLWAMSAADPRAARLAGDLLMDATERIEVLEVGAPSAADTTPADAVGSDVEGWEAVEVPVRYALAGSEHDGVVVLAPLEDAPHGSASSWRVVAPLTGELALPQAGADGLVPDVALSATVLPVGRTAVDDAVALFPAVYDVQLRADPYLDAEPESITVLAGSTATVADAELVPTEATTAELQAVLDGILADCAAALLDCPVALIEEADALGAGDDWSAEVTTSPSATVAGMTVTFEGAVLELQSPGGPVRLTVAGSAPWFLDAIELAPRLRPSELELEITR